MSLNRSCVAILMLALLAGCHSATKAPESSGMATMNAATSQPVTGSTSMMDELNNPNSPLAKRSVYFDFDSYSVKDEYQPLLQQHTQYVKTHPQRHVLIQ